MGLTGIGLALILLMALAYRGLSVLVVAPAAAMLAVMFAAGTPLLASYTQVFMTAAGQFVVAYFPLFLLGAVFGKLMDDSGFAQSIAEWSVRRLGRRRSVLAVVLSCSLLTYGGVSLFVVAFAVYPIAASLFRAASIPKRLMPATIGLGAFTFTMTALPGTPAIQNAFLQNGALVGICWDGPSLNLWRETEGRIKYLSPNEGALTWLDTMCMPSGAAHVDEAYEFINFMTTPEMGAAHANHSGYNSAAQGAAEFLVPDAQEKFNYAYNDGALIDNLYWWKPEPQWFQQLRQEYIERYEAA